MLESPFVGVAEMSSIGYPGAGMQNKIFAFGSVGNAKKVVKSALDLFCGL
jgi:hypothetical protein